MVKINRPSSSEVKLKHRVSITNKIDEPDSDTGLISNQYHQFDAYADIRAINRGASYFGDVNVGSNQNIDTHEIYIRYPKTYAVDITNYVKFGCRWFKINSVENIDERDRFLRLSVTEKRDDNRRPDSAANIQAGIDPTGYMQPSNIY